MIIDSSGAVDFKITITDLTGNTSYYVRAFATNRAGTGYGDVLSFTSSPILPVLTTEDISAITETTAECGGTITSDGGATVIARGVCWSIDPTPTTADYKTVDGTGTGGFASSLIGLTKSTVYYIRAYATNTAGTAYGEVKSFTTIPVVPILTTADISDITETTAECGGTITYDAGGTITARGVCWSTNPLPTVADNKTTDGTGSGSFTSSLTDLTASTIYYTRAYATIGAGTGYGEIVQFSTFPVLPVLTTAAVNIITETTAICGGTITFDGNAEVTARGICWSTDPEPTTADNKTIDGAGTGGFISSIIGLEINSFYYVRAYATNSLGTGYGNQYLFSTNTITDIDGNVYEIITIGTQIWMADNLKVTRYRNGDTIPNVPEGEVWSGLSSGGYCNYYDDEEMIAVYGRLYNGYSVNDSRNIAPEGWHVPTDEEWKQMEIYLGMSQAEADATGWRGTDEGGKLKETGTAHWGSPNAGATNESRFTALPGGYRFINGVFMNFGFRSGFWSSAENKGSNEWHRILDHNYSQIYHYYYDQRYGFSVRCVKD
ncbi:MAG: hypothetical protein GY865_16500 [candidate division Zixibacteria bacterium]|nr:hypothetical protein [candidate division Zixibacteria bacterium]